MPSFVNFDLVWLRYVDDVLAVLSDNIDFDNFTCLTQLMIIPFNKILHRNNPMPFPDVKVMRGKKTRPQFTIYPKHLHSNLYIDAFSGHSDKIKEAAINNNHFSKSL